MDSRRFRRHTGASDRQSDVEVGIKAPAYLRFNKQRNSTANAPSPFPPKNQTFYRREYGPFVINQKSALRRRYCILIFVAGMLLLALPLLATPHAAYLQESIVIRTIVSANAASTPGQIATLVIPFTPPSTAREKSLATKFSRLREKIVSEDLDGNQKEHNMTNATVSPALGMFIVLGSANMKIWWQLRTRYDAKPFESRPSKSDSRQLLDYLHLSGEVSKAAHQNSRFHDLEKRMDRQVADIDNPSDRDSLQDKKTSRWHWCNDTACSDLDFLIKTCNNTMMLQNVFRMASISSTRAHTPIGVAYKHECERCWGNNSDSPRRHQDAINRYCDKATKRYRWAESIVGCAFLLATCSTVIYANRLKFERWNQFWPQKRRKAWELRSVEVMSNPLLDSVADRTARLTKLCPAKPGKHIRECTENMFQSGRITLEAGKLSIRRKLRKNQAIFAANPTQLDQVEVKEWENEKREIQRKEVERQHIQDRTLEENSPEKRILVQSPAKAWHSEAFSNIRHMGHGRLIDRTSEESRLGCGHRSSRRSLFSSGVENAPTNAMVRKPTAAGRRG
ncbi:hypothetical protein MMC21_001385 [Puttea exsequens]|nr:hypothetical protein [Puttea exsequens]